MDENDRQVLADEKARLEVDKLKAETADLKHGGRIGARFARNGALITALFTAAGGVFALIQFNAQQEANRAQLKKQSDELEAGRREELRKSILARAKKDL